MGNTEINLPVSELLHTERFHETLTSKAIYLEDIGSGNLLSFTGAVVFTNARMFFLLSGGEDYERISIKYFYIFFDYITSIYTNTAKTFQLNAIRIDYKDPSNNQLEYSAYFNEVNNYSYATKIYLDKFYEDHLRDRVSQLAEINIDTAIPTDYIYYKPVYDPLFEKYGVSFEKGKIPSINSNIIANPRKTRIDGWLTEQKVKIKDIEERTKPFTKNNDLGNHVLDLDINLEDYLKELEQLIGLKPIKEEVRELINLVKIQEERREYGIDNKSINRHMVFSGSPGTGKTTVARLLGQIFKALGILSKGHFIETDRTNLVAGYLGQTAIKTSKVLESAKGGILFIDEAYSLVNTDMPSGNDSFGMESIDTILKFMEDNRDDFILIVAGYSNPMNIFLNSNPGLKSRFNTYLSFSDYSQSELIDILLLSSKQFGYKIDQQAFPHLNKIIAQIVSLKGSNFGNARSIRNLLEIAIKRQATRLINLRARTKEDLSILSSEDFLEEDVLKIN